MIRRWPNMRDTHLDTLGTQDQGRRGRAGVTDRPPAAMIGRSTCSATRGNSTMVDAAREILEASSFDSLDDEHVDPGVGRLAGRLRGPARTTRMPAS